MPKASLVAVFLLVVLAGLMGVVLAGRPDAESLRDPLVTQAFRPIGVGDPDWRTVVVRSVRDVPAPPAVVWATWERLQDWPRWGAPLIVEARWIDRPGWREGARFEQVLDLGFPFSRFSSVEIVGHAEPGQQVSWWKDQGVFRIHQLWSVAPMGGGSRVEFITVLQGPLAGMARGMIETSWRARFDLAVEGLAQAATRAHSPK